MPDTADLERQVADLQQQLQDQVGTLKRLIEISTMLSSTLNLSELLQYIISTAAELLRSETSSLLLVDEETGELTFEIATGQPGEEVVKQRIPAGQGIAGWVVQHAEPIIVNDPKSDSRFYTGIDEAVGFQTRNILAVPLKSKEAIIGVVEVINKVAADGFAAGDLELGEALASQAAIAIDNARMYRHLADAVVASRLSSRLYQLGID
jgi:GAF domain-containing protein